MDAFGIKVNIPDKALGISKEDILVKVNTDMQIVLQGMV